MPRDPTLPRWASASAKLQQYVRDHTDITLKQLFDEADKSKVSVLRYYGIVFQLSSCPIPRFPRLICCVTIAS